MSKFAPIAFAIMLTGVALAAQPAPNTSYYKKKSTSVVILLNSDRPFIKEYTHEEKVFFDNIENLSTEHIYYSDFDPVTKIEAKTIPPSGKPFLGKMVVSNFADEDVVQSGVFYGGYKRKNFTYPGLTPGATGVLDCDKQITDPHLLNAFFFNDNIFVETAEFSLTLPNTVLFDHRLFGTNKEQITLTETTGNGERTYTWTMKNIPPRKFEEDAPSRLYTSPHIALFIRSFQTRKGSVNVLFDVAGLYSWYNSLMEEMTPSDTRELGRLVNDLTGKLSTPDEKTKAIFKWVQQNIRYIAFEDGMAGFIPRSSDDVYVKRYGDCKDMANLLTDMLRLSGIEAYHAWIGTRSKPYRYDEVPSPILNNHMICAVKQKDGYIFLDATDPFVAYGRPSSMIQDKEALVGISPEKFEVIKVPIVNASLNQRVDTVHMSLTETGVSGNFKSALTGFRKEDLATMKLRTDVRNEKSYLNDYFAIAGKNLVVNQPVISGLSEPNAPTITSFNFELSGYTKRVADKIYVNLNMYKKLPGEHIKKERDQPLEGDYQYIDKFVSVLDIPEGYVVSYIPVSVEKKWPTFSFTAKYNNDGKKVTLERTIRSQFLYLNKEQFGDWNSFLDALNGAFQQSISLSKAR